MRTGSVPRKIVLPDGELRRFHLPELSEASGPARRSPRGRAIAWVVLWTLFSLVCFHWSEGRLGPRSWFEATLGWFSGLGAEPPASAPEPRRTALAPAVEVRSAGEPAAIVAQPSLSSAPRPALSRHAGSFESLFDPAEGPAADPRPKGVDLLAVGPEAHEVYAGPSCDRAKLRFKTSFLAEKEDPASLELLGDPRRYGHCKPDLMSLRLCALVHQGEAIGVTVQSEPPNRRVATCAAIVAKTLHYPKQKRPQLLRAEVYFQ